jgi:predicted HicB family RNase H-like nuclease
MASHREKIFDMPSKHLHRAITPRPPDDVREAAQSAAARQGTNLNAVIIAFLRWYGGLTDKQPERPGTGDS